MTTYRNGGTLLGTLATWLVIGILALVALKVVAAVLGMVFGVGLFALFTVGPILLVGWLVLKILRWFSRGRAPAAI